MTSIYNKPLPIPQPESDPYWEAARNGELWLQRCKETGEYQFYPRVFSIASPGADVEWIKASGRATLYAFAIVHQPPHPGFAEDVPYITAIVELEEGPHMPANIVGIAPEPENLKIGMSLTVVFEKVNDEITLPKFTPA